MSTYICNSTLVYLSLFYPTDKIIKKEVSLEELVHAIEQGYMDDHLIPQKKNIPEKIDTIVHLENREEHKIIEECFNIHFAKKNSTEDIKADLAWNNAMRKIIYDFYYADFQAFGYDF